MVSLCGLFVSTMSAIYGRNRSISPKLFERAFASTSCRDRPVTNRAHSARPGAGPSPGTIPAAPAGATYYWQVLTPLTPGPPVAAPCRPAVRLVSLTGQEIVAVPPVSTPDAYAAGTAPPRVAATEENTMAPATIPAFVLYILAPLLI